MALVTSGLRWGGGGRHTGGGGLSSSPPAPRSPERLETRGGSGSRSHSLTVPPGGDKEERQEQVTRTPQPPPSNEKLGKETCIWANAAVTQGELAFGQQVHLPPGCWAGPESLPRQHSGKGCAGRKWPLSRPSQALILPLCGETTGQLNPEAPSWLDLPEPQGITSLWNTHGRGGGHPHQEPESCGLGHPPGLRGPAAAGDRCQCRAAQTLWLPGAAPADTKEELPASLSRLRVRKPFLTSDLTLGGCHCSLGSEFDQKEQKSFLRPRKDYWDFLCTALWRQRGGTEPVHFVHSQDKLKTPLAKGRALIRFCLAQGQLAESLQLCLLNTELTREWYGPRSPLVCPELREDLLDALYTLNAVAFDLDLQWPNLDEAWPMFSESCGSSARTQGRRPRKTKDAPKQLPGTRYRNHEDTASDQKGESVTIQPVQRGDAGVHRRTWEHREGCLREISAAHADPTRVQPEEPHTSHAGCRRDAPREDWLAAPPRSQQHRHLRPSMEKKREDPRSLGPPQSMWEPEGEGLQGAPRTGFCLENSTPSIQGQGERAEGAPKEVIGTEAEDRGVLPGAEGTPKGGAEWGHVHRLPASSPTGTIEDTMPGSRQELEVPSLPGDPRVLLRDLGAEEDAAPERPQGETGVTTVTRRKKQAAMALQDVVKSLRHGLQKTKEQAQHLEQLLKEREGELKTLQEQLSRCQEDRARLQTELEQKQQEAEKRDAKYEKELGGQRDLVRAMKMRVLELVREKDDLWQEVQRLSSMAPGCCAACSRVFGRLSRRYPCRLCGGLVCHACSVDYKKRERRCPPCSQKGEAQSH